MPFLFLAGAILSEITATTLMKLSDGFTRLWPSVGTAAGYLLSFALLAQALRHIEVGTAYAIWSGAGTAVVALIGVLALGESASAAKLCGVALVIAGVVVLNLGGGH
jgi:small multidrug resistance pump